MNMYGTMFACSREYDLTAPNPEPKKKHETEFAIRGRDKMMVWESNKKHFKYIMLHQSWGGLSIRIRFVDDSDLKNTHAVDYFKSIISKICKGCGRHPCMYQPGFCKKR